MSRLNKRGFTLFELMIVIVIIGVVYGLLVRNFTINQPDKEVLTLKNLPAFMREKFKNEDKKVELLCMDDCSICKFIVDSSESNQSVELFEQYSSPEVYTLVNENLKKIEFGDIFEDYKTQKVCFKYTLYPNKSSDRFVLVYKDNIFMYDNFYEKTKEFQTLIDAQGFWNDLRNEAKED